MHCHTWGTGRGSRNCDMYLFYNEIRAVEPVVTEGNKAVVHLYSYTGYFKCKHVCVGDKFDVYLLNSH
jgi:hypothetical protein